MRPQPAREHGRQDGATAVEDPGQVDVDRALPGGQRHLPGGHVALGHARVVDQDVDAPGPFERRRDHRFDACVVGHVDGDRKGRAAACREPPGQVLRGLERHVGDDHGDAVAHEPGAHRGSERAGGSGHDRDARVGSALSRGSGAGRALSGFCGTGPLDTIRAYETTLIQVPV